MPSAMLMVRGLRRAKVPTHRKLPISVEYLRTLKGMLDLHQIDQQILRATMIIGMFFMLRASEFLDAKNPLTPAGRRPILVPDIDLLRGGKLAHRGPRVGEVTLRISGSKTDWPNQGCVMSHTKVSLGAPNADICVVRALAELFARYPAKFSKNRDSIFCHVEERRYYSTLLSDGHPAIHGREKRAKPDRVSTPIASVWRRHCALPRDQRHRSRCALRAIGANSISAYLWEIHQMMAGLSDHMVMGGHMLHTATTGTARNEIQTHPKETSKHLKGSLARWDGSDDY